MDALLDFPRRREKSFCRRGASEARLASLCVHFCFLLLWLNMDAGLDLIEIKNTSTVSKVGRSFKQEISQCMLTPWTRTYCCLLINRW
jgi:hypothetical protein